MAGGRGSRADARPRARAQAAVVPTGRSWGDRLEPARFAPSGRSLAVGLLLLAAAAGAYGLARTTSAFALTTIEVRGDPPADVAADVRRVLAGVQGANLLEVDLRALEESVEALPWVAKASLDRGFPHTLTVSLVVERPAAVLRQGARSWLVAASGRVLGPLPRRSELALPRVWLKRGVEVEVGRTMAGAPQQAVRALAPLLGAPLPARVASVRASRTELTLVLRSGFEIRLGGGSELPLKLEIARRILPSLGPEGYLDVSVPKHPVAAPTLEPQVEVETAVSS